MRRLVVLGGLVLLFPRVAEAREEPFMPRLELAASSSALMATGDFCRRAATDVLKCEGIEGYFGLVLGLRGRPTRSWSFGVTGAYHWSQTEDGVTPDRREAPVQSRLWRLAADGRWHFLGAPRFDPYVELDLGIAKSWDVADSESTPGIASPMVGAAVGFDHPLLRHLLIGAAFRTQFVPFENLDMTEQREKGTLLEGPVLLWSLDVTLTGRLFL